MRNHLLALVALGLVGCTPKLPEGRFVCTTDAECPPSWACDTTISRCVSSTTDASTPLDGDQCAANQMIGPAGCIDRDECLTPNVCGAGQDTCVDSDPGFTCTCLAGWLASFDAHECLDIDECANGLDDCAWNTTCADTDGSYECGCNFGFARSGGACVSTCVPATDSDTGMVTLTAGGVELVSDTLGFDIDGLNNAARGSGVGAGAGRTIAGCDKLDMLTGIENGLGVITASLADTIGVEAELDAAIDGGTVPVSFALSRLVAGGAAQDPCVSVIVSIDGFNHTGVGALDDHVLSVTFANPVRLPYFLSFPDEACDGGSCDPGTLAIQVSAARMQIHLDATNTSWTEATIGGFVFVVDDGGDSAFDAANANGMRQALLDYADSIGMMSTIRETYLGAFTSSRDLRMNASGAIEPCAPPSTGPATTNRNAISVAYRFTP